MIEEIKEAIDILKEGGIILYPTDTIWGLGCDATNESACKRIFEIKEREEAKSMVVLASDMNMVEDYLEEVPEIARNLVEVSDKPLTIIYPGARDLAKNIVAPDGSVGIRIPNNEFCQLLLDNFRRPLVSTSANISGEVSPSEYSDINIHIINSADWVADPVYANESSGKASSIIKLGLGGEIQIIRE